MPSPLPDADAAILVRSLSLLAPVLLTWVLLARARPNERLAGATFLASAWVFTSLLAVNLVAVEVGWWRFEAEGGVFAGLPVDLWLGWTLLWGAAPILALRSVPLWLLVAGAVWLDLALMPASAPVVRLEPSWLVGEAVAVAFCFVPAQLLGRWTVERRFLAVRCSIQAVLFASLSLWIIPFAALAYTGGTFGVLLDRPTWLLSLVAQGLAIPGAMGAAAVLELYRHGHGTPFPWDPPSRLVMTGPYAYVANPMQLAMTMILVGFGLLLGSPAVALAGLVAGAFGSGFARWQEESDLEAAFGEGWRSYRAQVRAWIPRWRPIDGQRVLPLTPSTGLGQALRREGGGDVLLASATLYYAATCAECTAVGAWFRRQGAIGLRIEPAERYPGPPLTRITYVAPDGSVFAGVAALSRALDHLNLAWACLGWGGRLPGVCQLVQLLVDAVGGGPRQCPAPLSASHIIGQRR
jgi:protein-S-isoprenylcysteine O-methyltransferase Ste14